MTDKMTDEALALLASMTDESMYDYTKRRDGRIYYRGNLEPLSDEYIMDLILRKFHEGREWRDRARSFLNTPET